MKYHDEEFTSQGFRYAGIYYRKGDIFFTPEGEYKRGGLTCIKPFTKLLVTEEANIKGQEVVHSLSVFTTGLERNEVELAEEYDAELARLAGLNSASSFYKGALYCGVKQNVVDRVIRFCPYKRERGRNYSGLDLSFEAPESDLEQIGLALDQALDHCL